ncbi:MAG: T9SS type A sorting domain-containing protein, partial [candidate division WOR-3 bacterium]|nr:T9SS type A sorting domain-containing protein [candidate division WOR-3 bacterium]
AWYRLFNTGQQDWGLCVASDLDGNIIVGTYHDDGTTEKPGLIKISSNGDTIWSRMYPQLINYYIRGIMIDSQNNIYGCGHSLYNPIAIMIKCDTNGNLLWRRSYDWSDFMVFSDIVMNNNGEIFVTGDYGTGALIIVKFNNMGDTIWTRQHSNGAYLATGGMRLALDKQGNIVIAGYATDWNNYDALIVKYSSTGNMIWNRILNYQLIDYLLGVGVDDYNNIFATGSSGIWDSLDYLLVKLSPDGETLWTRIFNSGYDDLSGGVVVDNQNNPIITGSSFNGTDYDILTIKYQGTTGIIETSTHQSKRKRIKFKVLSNPVRDRCVILFNDNLSEKDSRLEIFDATGRIKKNIILEKIRKGNYQMNIDVSDLPSRVYFIRLKQGKEQLTERLVIVK